MSTEKIVKEYSINGSKESLVPRVWARNSIFAAVKQNNPTEIALSDGTLWRMGVQPPRGEINTTYLRGLDVRHAELIFKLLAFYRENEIDFNHKVDMSYYKLLKIVCWECSKQNLEKLKTVLGDLENIWTTIVTEKKITTFKILNPVATTIDRDNPDNPHLGYITFDSTFLAFLDNIEQFCSIRLDVLNNMTSNIAKACYLYLPSRALQNNAKKPFQITLTNLYKQINIKVPKYKSDRLKKMTQNKHSIIDQLDHALISYIKKLRVRLEETKDGKDYNFCIWSESLTDNDYNIPGQDSLRTWFINGRKASSGASLEFTKLIKASEPLSQYHIETLQATEIDWKKSKIFLEQSRSLLGNETFEWICGNVKDKVLCNHHSATAKPIKSPIAYLITLVRSELLGELPLY